MTVAIGHGRRSCRVLTVDALSCGSDAGRVRLVGPGTWGKS